MKSFHTRDTLLPEKGSRSPSIKSAVSATDAIVSTHHNGDAIGAMAAESSIPQPSGEWPLFGHLLAFLADLLKLLLRTGQECGDIGRIRIMSQSLIMVNAPELVHAILVEHAPAFEKGPLLRKFARQLIGDGLLSADNVPHKPRRRRLQPMFKPKAITSYAETMVQDTEQLWQGWKNSQVVNITSAMTGLTLRIVCQTLFGVDVSDQADELRMALTLALRMVVSEMSAPIHLPYEWPTPSHLRLRKALDRVDRTIYQMIAERRASGEERSDLLSALLHARHEDGSPASDVEVRDEAFTFFIAGHETTANALAWTWYLLCQHPDVYARMRDEVDRVLQGRSPTQADLAKLPYILQVFKETLRLYPPAYAFGRQAAHEVEVGGYRFPQDALILIAPYALHRRADIFPDPERFDPERFTPERERLLPRSAYIPFGTGPRVCIGSHFAMMEAHLILATLVQRVTFTLLDGQRIEPEPLISLRQKGGAKMLIQHREAR